MNLADAPVDLALDLSVTDLANALNSLDALVPALDEATLLRLRDDVDDLHGVYGALAEKITARLLDLAPPRAPDLWVVS